MLVVIESLARDCRRVSEERRKTKSEWWPERNRNGKSREEVSFSLSLDWTIHLFNGEGARVKEWDRLWQMKGAVAQYTAEIAYRSRWQYSGALARAWEFSEGVNNQAAQLSCPIQQTLTPNHTRIPFSALPSSRPWAAYLPSVLFSFTPLSLAHFLSLYLPPSPPLLFHSDGSLRVIGLTAYRRRLIKLFIISLNQYVWILKGSQTGLSVRGDRCSCGFGPGPSDRSSSV